VIIRNRTPVPSVAFERWKARCVFPASITIKAGSRFPLHWFVVRETSEVSVGSRRRVVVSRDLPQHDDV
jgi:hypothetical protein